jgi:hypothetical protein
VMTDSLFYILGYGTTDNFDRVINEFKKSYQLGKVCQGLSGSVGSSQSGVNEDSSLLKCYAVFDIQRTVQRDIFL